MTKLHALLVSLLAVVILGSCYVGRNVEKAPLAREPQGIRATLTLRQARLSGELLEVRDTALVILEPNPARGLSVIPYTSIRNGTFEQMRSLTIGNGHIPGLHVRERLRLLSRFPQGLDEELTRKLLAAYGQNEFTLMR